MVKPISSIMEKEVSNKDEKPKAHGVRYPWSDLFKLQTFILTRGVHFDGLPHGMSRTVQQAAKRHNKRVSVSVGLETVTVTVRN